MATDVTMPKVDMDQETGTVAHWLKKEGDEVKQGEIILEIETDKVAIEVEAPATGILSGILVEEGQTVPIATTIAYILELGEALPEAVKQVQPDEKPATPNVRQTDWEVPVTPVARKMAAAEGVVLSAAQGTGPQGRVTKKEVQEALTSPLPFGNGDGKVYATPAARRNAKEQGVVLKNINGSGPDGRIQAGDVLAAVEIAAKEQLIPGPLLSESEAREIVPLLGMRRTIAERLTASYQSIPHIYFTARIDMTRFNEARVELNAQIEQDGGVRISTTALITKIVAETLLGHRWLNSSFQAGIDALNAEIHLFKDVNIGVAVALEDGLIVPVVRDAANKGVAEIAIEVKELAMRAREGQLAPVDVRDGTFTISNLGPFGVEQFTPIINPPQAAILAVGAMQPEVISDADGRIVVRPIMHITLAADHRVVDGAVAAKFIADLKARLESPLSLFL